MLHQGLRFHWRRCTAVLAVALIGVVTSGCAGDGASSSAARVPSTSSVPRDASTTSHTGVVSNPSAAPPATPPDATEPTVGPFDGGRVPSGIIRAGPDDAFVLNDEGALFWHPGLAGDENGILDPAQVAAAMDAVEVRSVAGVVDGSVVYTRCCNPPEVVAATGRFEAPPRVITEGRFAHLTDTGDLMVLDDANVSLVDLGSRTVRASRLIDPGSEARIVDGWWGPAGPTVLVRGDAGYEVVQLDGTSLRSRARRAIDADPDATAAVAGNGPNGAIAIAVSEPGRAELQVFSSDTLERLPTLTRELPPGVESVRTTEDGAVMWVDSGTLWYKPADDTEPVALGAGSAAAWFVRR